MPIRATLAEHNDGERDARLGILALALPLSVRLFEDGADMAVQRMIILVFVFIVAYGWSAVFAKRLGRRPEAAQAHFAMLFCILLPYPVGWVGALLAVSFGWVFGREIFGGHALLSPALLALAFAIFSFPEGGYQLEGILTTRPEPLLALACLPGAALLLWKKALAWPVAGGAALGLMAGGAFNATATAATWSAYVGPEYFGLGHVLLGTVGVGVLFIAAAQDCAPRKMAARWLYGALVGVLIVVLRVANPDHPDGVAFAILLATLFAPLLDRALGWRSRDAVS